MRFLLPALLAVLVAGCQFEPRPEPTAQATSAQTETPATPEPPPVTAAPPTSGLPTPTASATPGDRPEVVLYVTEWCPYCKQAREFMAAEEIPHRVVDIESSAEASREYRDMGGTGGIPLVAVGTEKIEGWSAEMAREMLDAAGYD